MSRLLKIFVKAVMPILILGVGVSATLALIRSKPAVETDEPQAMTRLVRFVEVSRQDLPVTVRAQGTVLPRTETALAAQVAGQVVGLAPNFETGGFFEPGEVLLTLDPRDFELEIVQAEAEVAQARLSLVQHEAEAWVAQKEWLSVGDGEADPLVLRRPQIAEAKASLAAAEAKLAKATLDLERTRVRGPFRGRVRSRRVGLGQFVTPGEALATLYAIDFAEVRLPISHRELAYLDVSLAYHGRSALRSGPGVTLSALFAGRRHTWSGQIVRTEGELDRRSRMIHLVAEIEDPYNRSNWGATRAPLAIGLFVDARIAGRTLNEVALLPRSALRGTDEVLVIDTQDRLRTRRVEVLRVEGDTLVAGEGLEAGEQVCVSPLDVFVEGMRVRKTEVEGPRPPARDGPETADPAVTSLASTDFEPRGDEGEGGDSGDSEEPEPRAWGRLVSVHLADGGGEVTTVRLEIDGEFSFSSSRLPSPERVVIDLHDVVKANRRSVVQVARAPFTRVRIAQFVLEPAPISRIVFDLHEYWEPRVERTAFGLSVAFDSSVSPR